MHAAAHLSAAAHPSAPCLCTTSPRPNPLPAPVLLLAGASLAAAIEDPPQCVAMGNVIPEGEKGRGSVETVGDMDMYPGPTFFS